jgi:hypothetical protein
MLSATVNAAYCPKLPKFAKICPKMKFHHFSVFQKKKTSTCRGGTRACFHYSDFQSKNFSYTICIVKKQPLYVNFSIPLCGKYFFWQPSTTLVNMRFCTHVPNSSRNKSVKSSKPYLHPKMVFWPPKHCCTSQAQWKKTFSLTLNLMISQTVRNECLRFGGHVGIQVSYKIL